MQQCMRHELDKVGAEVDRAFALAMSKADVERGEFLDRSQAAWRNYVDAECALQGDELRGGTGEPRQTFGCWLIESRRRVKELHDDTDFSVP
jgi:uncharacterized protein YecT (DUF1311 family)